MFTIRQLSASLLVLSLSLVSAAAQTQTSQQETTTKTSIIIERQLVRFTTPSEAVEWHLVVTNQQAEVVFDSGLVYGTTLEWPLKNQQDELIQSGLYAYTLTTKALTDETARTQRGHLILDRASSSDRVWLTSTPPVGIGAGKEAATVTVVGNAEATVGGAELPTRVPSRVAGTERGELPKRAADESADKTSVKLATAGTLNRIAKFAADGTTLIDSTVTETGGGDIGIGTTMPGGVLDLQRAGAGDILQRFWNTGTGGAKLRYVAQTGATSQVQLTDLNEWLASIAGDNSIGMQFRVRAPGDPNTEAGLANAVRLSILRNGNVGIGTNDPMNKLTLDLGSNAPVDSGIMIQGNSSTLGDIGLRIKNTGPGGLDWYIDSTNINSNYGGGVLAFAPVHAGATMILTSGGHVGIGTITPATPLQVNGLLRSTRVDQQAQYIQLFGGDAASIRLTAQSSDAIGEKALVIQNLSGAATPGVLNTIQFQVGTTAAPSTKMIIDKDGNVGIGTPTPGSKLDVNGNVCSFNISCGSDARLKEQVSGLRYGLPHLLRLRPVSWKWKDPAMQQLPLGLIAQEVADVIPELLLREADPAKPLGLNYMGLIPVVIKAIQEQQTQLEAKDAKIQNLEDRLATLEQALRQLLGQQGQTQPSKRQQ